MYCTYCNHPNSEGNRFCESCGKPLENRSKEIKFKKCPYCAEEIQDEAKVCRYCGRGLENSTELKFAISPVTNKKVQQLDKAVGEHMAMGWILLSKTDYAAQMQYPKKFDWAIFLSTVALVPLTIGSLFFLPFVYLIYWSLIQKPKMIVITVNDNLQVLVDGALMTGATSTGMTYWGLVSKFSLWGLLTKKVTPGMSPEEMTNVKKYNNKLVMYIIVAVIGICFICTLLGVLPSIVQYFFPPSKAVQNSPIITEPTKVVLAFTPTSTPTKEITGILSTLDLPTTQIFAPTLSPSLSNVSTPNMGIFSACIEPCNGSNSMSTFPEAITKLHVEWDYENIPYGARYIRKWTMDGREWIRYDCIWSGNKSGRDSVKLTEPKGFHSGTWELTISVNGEVLLREQINVSGNWDYWDPAGTLNSCYGTTD